MSWLTLRFKTSIQGLNVTRIPVGTVTKGRSNLERHRMRIPRPTQHTLGCGAFRTVKDSHCLEWKVADLFSRVCGVTAWTPTALGNASPGLVIRLMFLGKAYFFRHYNLRPCPPRNIDTPAMRRTGGGEPGVQPRDMLRLVNVQACSPLEEKLHSVHFQLPFSSSPRTQT